MQLSIIVDNTFHYLIQNRNTRHCYIFKNLLNFSFPSVQISSYHYICKSPPKGSFTDPSDANWSVNKKNIFQHLLLLLLFVNNRDSCKMSLYIHFHMFCFALLFFFIICCYFYKKNTGFLNVCIVVGCWCWVLVVVIVYS